MMRFVECGTRQASRRDLIMLGCLLAPVVLAVTWFYFMCGWWSR